MTTKIIKTDIEFNEALVDITTNIVEIVNSDLRELCPHLTDSEIEEVYNLWYAFENKLTQLTDRELEKMSKLASM